MTLRRPTPFAVYTLLLAVIIGFAVMPLIDAIGASMAGTADGCRVDEAGRYPCIVFGAYIGAMLSFLSSWAG